MKLSQTLRQTLLSLCVVGALVSMAAPEAQAQSLRPEIGNPLQAASNLLKAGKAKEALAKIRETDGVGNKTPKEIATIEGMRGSAASSAGDAETAMRAFEAVLNTGAAGANQLTMIDALAKTAYQRKDWGTAAKWANRYFKEGGTSGSVRTVLVNAYFQSGDMANALKETQADLAAEERAGRPSKDKLKMLANIYLRQKNNAGYVSTVEKLLANYPDKSLWVTVIDGVQRKSTYSDRLALDVYRLQLATGNLATTKDFMEMAQLSLQSGFISEAKKIVDDAYTKNLFGTGAEADRQKRLRDLIEKRAIENQKTVAAGSAEETEAKANKDGAVLVNLGYNVFTSGQAARGIQMMQDGIAKGNLRRADDAQLKLGTALIQSGQKPKGVAALKLVTGQDGAQDLANLWTIFSRS